jgi:hypothetical protein
MVPVVQEKMAQIHIVVCTCRTIDQNPAKYPIPRLDVKVRVIPTTTVLDCPPTVGVGVTRSNRALCNAGDTVHLIRPILADAVKMNTSAVILERVLDMHH